MQHLIIIIMSVRIIVRCSLGSRPPPFRARLNYAHVYAANIRSPSPFFECLPHTHAHNLNAHRTGEAWNRG